MRILKLHSLLRWFSNLVESTRRADIVQIEDYSFIRSLALFLLFRPFNKQFIIVFHDKYFQKDPRKSIIGKLNLFLQKILLTLFDAAITPGLSVKEWFEELHGKIVCEKMVVIPNGTPDFVTKKILIMCVYVKNIRLILMLS